MNTYAKITALYERLSIGDEQRGGEDSSSIKSQKEQLEQYAKQHHFTNIRHYTDDDESGRFFDRTGYSQMMEDVESGKVGIIIMKDLTRWGRDHVQVGIAMETFRQNNVRFIAINNGIDSINPESLEFAPFINILNAALCVVLISVSQLPFSNSACNIQYSVISVIKSYGIGLLQGI